MPALVTTKFRLHNAKQFIEAFNETTANYGAAFASGEPATIDAKLNTNMYMFIGKSTAWDDDTAPPTPGDSIANTEYSHYRDMLAAKKITSTDVAHVIPRHDWTSGSTYVAYDDTTEDLIDGTNQFYVVTDEFNVYKCLAAGGSGSTVKPTGQSTAIIESSDGYKWKFMYQISAARALKFVTPNYVPVQTLRLANTTLLDDGSTQHDVELYAETTGNGSIEVVKVNTNGSSYVFANGQVVGTSTTTTITLGNKNDLGGSQIADNAIVNSFIFFPDLGEGARISAYNSTANLVTMATSVTEANGDPIIATRRYEIGPTITIVGDGEGATARAVANTSQPAQVEKVEMISVGNNYSTATATVTANSSNGSGATLRPVIAPRGGHGSDPVSELGGYFVMINSRLEYQEDGDFTVNNDFRKIGLLVQPKLSDGSFSTTSLVDQAVTIQLSSVNGTFNEDELVTGEDSGMTGRVVDFRNVSGTNYIRLVDVVYGANTTDGYDGLPGSFQDGEVVEALVGDGGAGATGTVATTTGGELLKFSGDVIYIENRSPITRADDQIEDVKIVIEF